MTLKTNAVPPLRVKRLIITSIIYLFNKFSGITRAVRKVSGHFEYLDNRSHGIHATWQPVRRELSVHPGTVTLQWG